jgi:hypothetical protein
VHVHGSLDGNPLNDGSGMQVSASKQISITNSEFQEGFRGLAILQTKDVRVIGNRFHTLRSDGVDLAQVNDVLIDSNHFTDFYKQPGDHPDGIQFWTSNTTAPSTDIIVQNNQIVQRGGAPMQGIFFRDELGTFPFERVRIINNLVYQAIMPNGITVMGGRDIIVTGNSTLSPPGDKVSVWIRLENVERATMTSNVADRYVQRGNNREIRQQDNIALNDERKISRSIRGLAEGLGASPAALITDRGGYQLKGEGGAIDLRRTSADMRAPGRAGKRTAMARRTAG